MSDPVDDYLTRVDRLLARRAAEQPPRASDQADGSAAPAAPAAPAARPESSLVAEAFAKLLALEDGEPGAQPVRLVTGDATPAIDDAMLDELTRRVLERLAPDAVRGVVADVVSEVAERLVTQEIDRIRKKHA